MSQLLERIKHFCKTNNCLPSQLVLQWSVRGGCNLVVHLPTGSRVLPLVTHSLDMVAKALFMLALQEPEQPQATPPDQGMPHYDFGKPKPASPPEPPKSWREAGTPQEVLGLFPKTPTADELIDLFELNKKFQDQAITKLLSQHSQKL